MPRRRSTDPVPATAPPASAGAPAGPCRVCFERIVPDDLDPGLPFRRLVRGTLLNLLTPLGAQGTVTRADEVRIARLAVMQSKTWGPGGPQVNCRFLDGSPKLQARVQAAAKTWEQHANLTLNFVSSGTAEIRISFRADPGSWSAIGKDATNSSYFPTYQPTMNFGWLREDSPDPELDSVVLHEFGHALGCLHEHQSPAFDREWDVDAVYRAFSGPPNYWSPDAIRSNVLDRYPPGGIVATRYDPASIMLYWFDAELFSDGLGPTPGNDRLSPSDIAHIATLYPGRSNPPVQPPVVVPPVGPPVDPPVNPPTPPPEPPVLPGEMELAVNGGPARGSVAPGQLATYRFTAARPGQHGVGVQGRGVMFGVFRGDRQIGFGAPTGRTPAVVTKRLARGDYRVLVVGAGFGQAGASEYAVSVRGPR